MRSDRETFHLSNDSEGIERELTKKEALFNVQIKKKLFPIEWQMLQWYYFGFWRRHEISYFKIRKRWIYCESYQ